MSDKTKGLIQFILVIVFIAGSFAISFSLQSQKSSAGKNIGKERVVFVSAEVIQPEPYRISFDVTGNVEARADIGIVPQVQGRIIEMNENFFSGGLFKAGETLFRIEPRDFELEVQRLEAEVARARTTFNIEQAESKAALEEWRLINGSKKAPSLVARKPQKDEAWANLKAAKAQLENAKLESVWLTRMIAHMHISMCVCTYPSTIK